ncbi:hypothetical protein VNO77_30730 [Canavalia gladiata]|uniref:Wall-associated receptor kinase galacturonan-binding domain-containing protein n=1 Tax=Canavalia gladiata TaxID=3824 RepID=A0AAN9KR36_CANGL
MIALSSFSRRAQSRVTFAALFFVLFHQICTAKHHPLCSSSCGKIRNITYPFRLRGDPRDCGLQRYELECVKNVAVLTLFSGKYHVQDINYKRFKIYLTDAGVVEDTACSIPRYFLYNDNFSSIIGPDYSTPDLLTLGYTGDSGFSNLAIAFLNCTNKVKDNPLYVEVDRGHCDSGGHVYALLSSSMGSIEVGCRLKVATYASETLTDLLGWDTMNVSYADIQKALVEGFWLSWLLPVTCRDLCGKGITCSLNYTTQQVQCDPQRYCEYAHHSFIVQWEIFTDCFQLGSSSQIRRYIQGRMEHEWVSLVSYQVVVDLPRKEQDIALNIDLLFARTRGLVAIKTGLTQPGQSLNGGNLKPKPLPVSRPYSSCSDVASRRPLLSL